jgi:hypothetical protein
VTRAILAVNLSHANCLFLLQFVCDQAIRIKSYKFIYHVQIVSTPYFTTFRFYSSFSLLVSFYFPSSSFIIFIIAGCSISYKQAFVTSMYLFISFYYLFSSPAIDSFFASYLSSPLLECLYVLYSFKLFILHLLQALPSFLKTLSGNFLSHLNTYFPLSRPPDINFTNIMLMFRWQYP